MILSDYQPSLAEVRDRLKSWGYCLAKSGDEMEAYPKGKRGDLSYFSTDRNDIMATVRAEALKAFRAKLEDLPIPDEAKDALVEWYAYHRNEWRDNLIWQAWFSGRYDGFGYGNVAGTLQRLRNINGHEVVAMIKD